MDFKNSCYFKPAAEQPVKVEFLRESAIHMDEGFTGKQCMRVILCSLSHTPHCSLTLHCLRAGLRCCKCKHDILLLLFLIGSIRLEKQDHFY